MTEYNINEGFGRTLKGTLDLHGPNRILDEAVCFLTRYRGRFFGEKNIKMVQFALELVKDHPDLDKAAYEHVRQSLEEARKVPPPQEPPKPTTKIDAETINEWLTLNELIKLLTQLVTKIDAVSMEGHPFSAHNSTFLHDAKTLKNHLGHMLPLIQALELPNKEFKKVLDETWRAYNKE